MWSGSLLCPAGGSLLAEVLRGWLTPTQQPGAHRLSTAGTIAVKTSRRTVLGLAEEPRNPAAVGSDTQYTLGGQFNRKICFTRSPLL